MRIETDLVGKRETSKSSITASFRRPSYKAVSCVSFQNATAGFLVNVPRKHVKQTIAAQISSRRICFEPKIH